MKCNSKEKAKLILVLLFLIYAGSEDGLKVVNKASGAHNTGLEHKISLSF